MLAATSENVGVRLASMGLLFLETPELYTVRDFAIGFYDAPGAATIGKVWASATLIARYWNCQSRAAMT